MTINISINGLGRIGRNVARLLNTSQKGSPVKLVAVNDLTDAKTLAHLLKYDSVHEIFPGTVEAVDGAIKINGAEVKVFAEKDSSKLPCSSVGVNVVL